ncbi:uncharacterized protein TNCV_2993551 [Trichonephila clavipes]|nr:uncharacterized protein TNCV_2993551 [Trichonephila clavipes]
MGVYVIVALLKPEILTLILKENGIKGKPDFTYFTDLLAKFNEDNLHSCKATANILLKQGPLLQLLLPQIKLNEYNIGRREFSMFLILSQTICQEDDSLTYVQHLNALYSDFETKFGNAFTVVIPQCTKTSFLK